MWVDLDVEDRGIEAKLLCLKELSKEEARKGIVFVKNLRFKTKNVVCSSEKTRF